MKTKLRAKPGSESKAESSILKLTVRCNSTEAAVLDSAYKLYCSRSPRPISKSWYLKNLMLASLNLEEDNDSGSELYVDRDRVDIINNLSEELNTLIKSLDDDRQCLSSLVRVTQCLKTLTGYKSLPEAEIHSSPTTVLNPVTH